MKTFMYLIVNWKSSLAGVAGLPLAVGAFLSALGGAITAACDGDPSTAANWSMVAVTWTAVTASVGLLATRDADKSTEQSRPR